MNIIQVLRQYNPKSIERRWNKFGLAPLGVYILIHCMRRLILTFVKKLIRVRGRKDREGERER